MRVFAFRDPYATRSANSKARWLSRFDVQIDDKLGRTWPIGVGVAGTPRRWPFQATDVRGVRGGAPQVQLDRRGRHRRAASVARFTPRMCGACAGERRKLNNKPFNALRSRPQGKGLSSCAKRELMAAGLPPLELSSN